MASPTDVAQGAVVRYAVDSAKSRFLVKAAAAGMLSAFGHNPTIAIRGFTGEAGFRPQAPEQSSLRLEIDAASLAVSNDVSVKDRQEMERAMKEEVLEVSRFPTIRYEGAGAQAVKIADGLYRVTLAGKLALHGVERDLSFPCNVTVGDDNLRTNGEFSIRQSDFQIQLVSVAGGALKLKDELKFTFDIAAHRVQEALNA
jgi:polyisoprenoid-binding protein YceI